MLGPNRFHLSIRRQELRTNPQPTANSTPPFSIRVRENIKKRGFKGFLFGVSVAYFVTSSVIQWRRQVLHDRIHDDTVLHWKITAGSIVEAPAENTPIYSLASASLTERGSKPLSLLQILRALSLAETDDRITGLVASFGGGQAVASAAGLGFAQAEELHQAIERFKKAKIEKFGKEKVRVVCYSESFENQIYYYLATAFDNIYIQPTGGVHVCGMSTTMPFFKRLLDKIGIKVHTETRNEYKSVTSMVTEEKWPEKQKQNLFGVISELNDQFVRTISKARTKFLPEEQDVEKRVEKMREMFDLGSVSSDEAYSYGLIDGKMYRHNVSAFVGQSFAKTLPHYLRVRENEKRKEDKTRPKVTVGLVYLLGNIVRSGGQYSAAKVSKALMDAGMDPMCDAIVLRIDSGGGDVVASDTMWEAVRRVQILSRKPVIVSFGNKCASGGYYLSTFADAIVSNPSTLTGSIGVAAVRPTVTPKLLDRLGITIDDIHIGKGTLLNSPLHELSPEQLKRYQKHVDDIYHDFLIRVSRGRKIPMNDIDKIAGGRIYAGTQAQSIGLVDHLGGLQEAINIAAQYAFTSRKHLIQALEGVIPMKSPVAVVKLSELGKYHVNIEEHEILDPSFKRKSAETQSTLSHVKAKQKEIQPVEEVKNLVAKKGSVKELQPVPSIFVIDVKVYPKKKSFWEMLQEAQFAEDYQDIFWMSLKDGVRQKVFAPMAAMVIGSFGDELMELLKMKVKEAVNNVMTEVGLEVGLGVGAYAKVDMRMEMEDGGYNI